MIGPLGHRATPLSIHSRRAIPIETLIWIAVLYTVVCYVCAMICRSMAASMNRSRNRWTVLGFLFLLPAVIVLMLMPERERGEGERLQ